MLTKTYTKCFEEKYVENDGCRIENSITLDYIFCPLFSLLGPVEHAEKLCGTHKTAHELI